MLVSKKIKKSWGSRVKSLFSYLIIFVIIGWGIDMWRSQSLASGMAPTLSEISVQGELIDLHQMSQDKPVLVYFWATWCSVCRAVSPSVEMVDGYYQVLSVALNSGTDQRIQQYLKHKEYDFSVINDPKGMIGREWGIAVTPTLFVIHQGEITSVTTGFTSPFGIWLRLFFS